LLSFRLNLCLGLSGLDSKKTFSLHDREDTLLLTHVSFNLFNSYFSDNTMLNYFMKMKKSKKRKAISRLRLEGQARRRREEDKGGQHEEVEEENEGESYHISSMFNV